MISAFGVEHGYDDISKASAAQIAASQKNAREVGELARYLKKPSRLKNAAAGAAIGAGAGLGIGAGLTARAKYDQRKKRRG